MRTKPRFLAFLVVASFSIASIGGAADSDPVADWNDEEIELLRSLWLGSLEPLPPDNSNAVANNQAAARFGHALFFDVRLSGTGDVSCATCHQPARRFTDGLPKGVAIGVSKRNTPSIVGTAYSPWQYWDGRRDSQWSQAVSPLEDPNEHGTSRRDVVKVVVADDLYRATYEQLFGHPPDLSADEGVDRAFANVGMAIAAYERLLMPGPSRFDDFVAALIDAEQTAFNKLNADEVAGLRLFIGDAQCIRCHNGPLLTNNEFHNTGVLPFPGEPPDKGRVDGIRLVRADPYNCLGQFNDAAERSCDELVFARTGAGLIGAVRTPSLRNIGGTEPFMHKGQLATLREVLEHYNEAPLAVIGHNEAEPLGLGDEQLEQLEAFLLTLNAPIAADKEWLRAPETTAAALPRN
ncbi:MAG: cytochrome-c peroxidase [Gammaproteobacteria bacterium]|nr:cytochrome-c peroxidase [Gammaproteobacteria bacterium]